MRVSVVVPTRDRPALLERCLAALSRQSLCPKDYEVVVVDDGSDIAVEDALGEPLTARGVSCRVLRLSRSQGPAGARNAGIEEASGEVLAFTDDDCEPCREWLAEGIRSVAEDLDIVTGPTCPDPTVRERGPFDYSMHVPGPDPRFSTCNVFYRRELVRSLQGFRKVFDSSRGYHLGEDTDLAWRAIERGARVGFNERAVVHHAVRPRDFGEFVRSRWRLEGLVPLVKRYPAVKKVHYSRFMYRRTHLFVYLGFLGILIGPLWPWSLISWGPWIVYRAREKRIVLRDPLRFVRRNRHLPHLWIGDLVECWVFAVSSVHSRHLYL